MSMQTRSKAYPACFDPYLRYAIETEFDYFRDDTGGEPRVVLLVQLHSAFPLASTLVAEDLSRLFKVSGLEVGPTQFPDARMQPKSSRFLTLRGPRALVDEATWGDWDKLAASVTLSMPIASTGALHLLDDVLDRPKCGTRTVVAVIDDGCPFARSSLRVNPAQTPSRVFAIWDQNDPSAALVPIPAKNFGAPPVDFNYGLEYRRASWVHPKNGLSCVGIDQWINQHKTSAGQVDEDACYVEAGFESLRGSCSHGAHVLDVLADPMPPSSGFSSDPGHPPSFALKNDAASTSDIIFVQVPREAVDDPTGDWLDVQVKDALTFILSCIDPSTTRSLVVNLSYGPTTCPHDGMSNLELCMSELVQFYDGKDGRLKLDIVIAGGNSRLSDWHVKFRSRPRRMKACWVWRIPPDNPVPVFVEIWVPKGQESHVTGTLAAPVPGVPYAAQPPLIFRADAPGSTSYGWLIVLPATQGNPTTPAPPLPKGSWSFASVPAPAPAPTSASFKNLPPGPHGDWQIELALDSVDVAVHAYVARSSPNMGARVAVKPTRFVDVGWESKYGAAAAYRLKDGVRKIGGSLVRRAGTLNGIGTTVVPGIWVAGGYRLRDRMPSQYSSIGPSRGIRMGPDYAYPCDESLDLPGIRSGGNRSGTFFRLVGTSTAAPQLARQIAKTPSLKPHPKDSPVNGGGDMPSP